MRAATALVVFLMCGPVLSQANLLQNGDFEIGPPIPGNQTEFTVTGAQLPGWFIPFGNCDINGPFWTPSSGSRSIDLHGTQRGAIEQTVPTHPGARYSVLFDLGASGTQACVVLAAGQSSPTFTHVGAPFPRVTYARDQSWSFAATGASTTVRFDSASGGNGASGAHIDNVRVYRTTVPATFQRFGAGCAGSNGTPMLDALAGSRPLLGQEFNAELTDLSVSLADAVFLLIGLDRAAPPTPLDPIGMPGCNLLVVPIDATPLLKFNGVARWRATVPNALGLLGATVVIQGFAFDRNPAPNSLGATTSNGGELFFGNS